MALEIVKLCLKYISYFFILYMLFYSTFLFISSIIGSITLFKNRYKDTMHNNIEHDYYIPVSILVPAYNEEKVICSSVKSLLSLDYKLYEIIVINDGSSDKTLECLIDEYSLIKVNKPYNRQLSTKNVRGIYEGEQKGIRITVIDKENGGKSDSLNAGINVSKFPYFLAMDADSALQKDSLELLVRPILEDENVVACGGFIRLSNAVELRDGVVQRYELPKNMLASMQVLEYDRSFLASRIMLDQYNGNLIISGAFGLFQKELVLACNGYDINTVGEDFELVSKMHVFCKKNDIDYSIRYIPEAICWTQAPEKLGDLIKQRKRWYIGLVQCMIKYRELFCNYHYGFLSFISYFYYLFFELLSPFIEVIGNITTIVALCFGLLNVPFMILFYILYTLFGCVMTLTTFFARIYLANNKLSFIDILRAIYLCIFEIVFLRFILMVSRLTSFIGYKNKRMKWEKLDRTELKV